MLCTKSVLVGPGIGQLRKRRNIPSLACSESGHYKLLISWMFNDTKKQIATCCKAHTRTLCGRQHSSGEETYQHCNQRMFARRGLVASISRWGKCYTLLNDMAI
jgi:hypothetical protein